MGGAMNLMTPPEIADGGYWYVVPVVIDSEEGGKTPGLVAGKGWCAWYGTTQVVIRCPEAITGMVVLNELPDNVLSNAGYTKKPFSRIRGL